MDRVNGIGRVAGGLAIFVSAVMMKGFGETLGISAILGELSFIYDFAVWTCIAIGLVGTTIGMIDLLIGIANISLSNPYYLPVIGRKGRAKKAKINYIDNNKLMDAIEKTVLSPIREVWGLTQNKDSIYHQEYVSTYEGLTPYLEEIVSALRQKNAAIQRKKNVLRHLSKASFPEVSARRWIILLIRYRVSGKRKYSTKQMLKLRRLLFPKRVRSILLRIPLLTPWMF